MEVHGAKIMGKSEPMWDWSAVLPVSLEPCGQHLCAGPDSLCLGEPGCHLRPLLSVFTPCFLAPPFALLCFQGTSACLGSIVRCGSLLSLEADARLLPTIRTGCVQIHNLVLNLI